MNPIYSLDGNSIYDVALKFERLGIQEMNKNPEFSFQGVNIGDSNKDGIQFKNDFDKLFSLSKEFYVKIIKGTQGLNDNIEAELEEKINKMVFDAGEANSTSIKNARDRYSKQFRDREDYDAIPTDLNRLIDSIGNKSTAELSERIARLDKIVKPIIDQTETIFVSASEMGDVEVMDVLLPQLDYTIMTFAATRKSVYDALISELKSNIEYKSKIDVRSALRLTRFEGTASNVLRDIILTSNSMVQDVNNKRVLLQDSLKLDTRLVRSIKYDNSLIMNEYVKELQNHPEVKENYMEPFNKAQANLMKLNIFVNEL